MYNYVDIPDDVRIPPAAANRGRGRKALRSQRIQALVLVPSKELCKQTYTAMKDLLHYCSETVTITHLAVDSLAVQVRGVAWPFFMYIIAAHSSAPRPVPVSCVVV